ncbi:hypothetical protein [Streptomyces sp. NPDC058307]|uniref:hypothetical protein n=1 Tax=Streptomyces sp. NPDC058307 TaxID=3346439 RepID=UPI0036E76E00
MADYATHAQRAHELLAGMNPRVISGKFASPESAIAAAQVEALLALAAAVAKLGTADVPR